MIPFEMEKVRGMSIIAKNAGIASSNWSHSISNTGFIIKTPTKTRAGAVAIVGIIDNKGERNKKGRKSKPATTETSPVLPPCWMPAADSIKLVVGDVPTIPEKVVAIASISKLFFILKGFPFSSIRLPACDTPTNVDNVSKRSVKKRLKMAGR